MINNSNDLYALWFSDSRPTRAVPYNINIMGWLYIFHGWDRSIFLLTGTKKFFKNKLTNLIGNTVCSVFTKNKLNYKNSFYLHHYTHLLIV